MIRKGKHREEQGLGLVRHNKEHAGVVPPGTVVMYGGNTTTLTPEGWLLCDASSYRTDKYPRLFRAIGYTYGGSGRNFNVPDMRSRFPVGAGTYAALGADEGNTETNRGTNHTHGAGTLDTVDHNVASNTPTTGAANRATAGAHDFTGDTAAAGDAADFPHTALNFLIKT